MIYKLALKITINLRNFIVSYMQEFSIQTAASTFRQGGPIANPPASYFFFLLRDVHIKRVGLC